MEEKWEAYVYIDEIFRPGVAMDGCGEDMGIPIDTFARGNWRQKAGMALIVRDMPWRQHSGPASYTVEGKCTFLTTLIAGLRGRPPRDVKSDKIRRVCKSKPERGAVGAITPVPIPADIVAPGAYFGSPDQWRQTVRLHDPDLPFSVSPPGEERIKVEDGNRWFMSCTDHTDALRHLTFRMGNQTVSRKQLAWSFDMTWLPIRHGHI